MKLIIYPIVYVVYGVSQTLYKLFGINTPSRKDWLKNEADKLQDALDAEHKVKEYVNSRLDTDYTTKKAIDIAEANNWIATD